MAVMNPKKLGQTIGAIRKASEKFAEVVQEALISCAYYAMKDGNTTPFNQLLDAVGAGTRIKGLTMWAELYAPVHVKDGRFELSKGAARSIHVADEADFAEFEETMRAGTRWDKIVPKEKAESIWDAGKYMDKVYKKLDERGEHDLVRALKDAEMAYRIKQNGSVTDEAPAAPKLLAAA